MKQVKESKYKNHLLCLPSISTQKFRKNVHILVADKSKINPFFSLDGQTKKQTKPKTNPTNKKPTSKTVVL